MGIFMATRRVEDDRGSGAVRCGVVWWEVSSESKEVDWLKRSGT